MTRSSAGQRALAQAKRLHTYLWLSAHATVSDCTEELGLRNGHRQSAVTHRYTAFVGRR